MKKIAMMLTSIALVAAVAVGGTLAYLTSTTDAVTNTFTIGNVAITLTEPAGESNNYTFKMSPDADITKDPTVGVTAGSEACYLFVKVEEGADLSDYITYEIAEGWTPLTGVTGVYYREVDQATATAGATYSVLKGDKVHALKTVTGIAAGADVTLKFTAYAIQADAFEDAAAAWAEL